MAADTEHFQDCLKIISHTRAGWDYELFRKQRDKEIAEEKAALAEARTIWRDNPEDHEALRAAFQACKPLATMDEIERSP